MNRDEMLREMRVLKHRDRILVEELDIANKEIERLRTMFYDPTLRGGQNGNK